MVPDFPIPLKETRISTGHSSSQHVMNVSISAFLFVYLVFFMLCFSVWWLLVEGIGFVNFVLMNFSLVGFFSAFWFFLFLFLFCLSVLLALLTIFEMTHLFNHTEGFFSALRRGHTNTNFHGKEQ